MCVMSSLWNGSPTDSSRSKTNSYRLGHSSRSRSAGIEAHRRVQGIALPLGCRSWRWGMVDTGFNGAWFLYKKGGSYSNLLYWVESIGARVCTAYTPETLFITLRRHFAILKTDFASEDEC
ncbi:hypothetical protein M404DRAFT_395499 [Pisolithus tinctorius Marx 270]|uniref:Uncharacterized protein n=1 Tax=Pisolithus tinctorius Marx 270 TaxID=870435 RepID=A0A0C3KDT6_PISTI|nr:hypothetical protein M404DRAFT_395499 [Pisolithus tinctorius Marx 270]